MPDPPDALDLAVWSIQDDLVEWAAVELVDRCRRRYRDAEELLGARTVLGLVTAGETTFFIRTVRDIVTLIGDAYRESWLRHRPVTRMLGMSEEAWHEREWRLFFMQELFHLLGIPRFVRNALIATLHPDTDIGMAARYEVLLLLRQRYGMPVPTYLRESHLEWNASNP